MTPPPTTARPTPSTAGSRRPEPGPGAVGPAATFRRWLETAVRPRLLLVRLLPDAGWGLVALATVVNLALGVLPVAFVVATSVVVGAVPDAVEGGAGSPAWDHLVRVFLLATAAFVGQQVLAPVQAALNVRIKRRVDGRNLDAILGLTLGTVSIAPMEDAETLDALTNATTPYRQDISTPGEAVGGSLALVARYLRLAAFGLLVAVLLAWWAGAAVVVATMVFRYGQRGGLRKYAVLWRDNVPIRRRAQYLADTAMGAGAAKEARVYGLTDWLTDRYAEAHARIYGPVARRRREVYLRPYLGYTAAGLVLAGAVLVAAARAGAAGDLDLTALALVLQATTAALLLGSYYVESDMPTQYGMLAVAGRERLAQCVAQASAAAPGTTTTDRAAPDDAAPAVTTLPSHVLRLEAVRFGYPGSERLVLDGLDLELPAGRSTAVVGVNGAGKTTLVKLLTRLYEPTGGRITADGADVAALDPVAWRRQVSVIFQDFARYELSAADNIAFGALHVPRDDAAVRTAAQRAGILGALERLPAGLDTVLHRAYPGGADLSGGQWQRIAIARSLYALQAGARVLVLDEPTSALDVRAEVAFFDRFVELTRGVTSLLISHRFSSVRRADSIVVVDAGRVVEHGTHDELLAADGHYARLFRLQAERFAAGLDAEGNEVDGATGAAEETQEVDA